MGKFIDLTGQKFGYMTVLYRVANHGELVAWLCKCDCGNTKELTTKQLKRGNTISCGCMVGAGRRVDVSGQRFGRLVAIEPCGTNKFNKHLFRCVCDCGNETNVIVSALINGSTKSCGCLLKEYRENLGKAKEINLIDQKFGLLTVLNKTEGRKCGSVVWECQCDCGHITYVNTRDLMSGHTQSCGCIKSEGERLIQKFLDKYNIAYQHNKCLYGCKLRRELPFDFWLPDYGICIEFDGQQHFENSRWRGAKLEDIQRRDAIKTKYCEESGIVLLRIPYWEKQN